jgi:hypothetical protein
MARAARAMATATKAMARKKVMAMAARAIETATRAASNKECNGNGNKEGNGDRVDGGRHATAMRVAGNKEGTGRKGNDDCNKSVMQGTRTKRAMATATRVAGK